MSPAGHPVHIPISDDSVHIGSGSTARVRLADPEVAPIHAEIQTKPLGHVIVRHGPTLLVNGKRASTVPLQDGDLISLGRSGLSFRLGLAPAQRQPTADDGSRALQILSRVYDLTRRLYAGDSFEQMADEMLADVVDLTSARRGMLVLFDGADDVVAKTTQQGEFDPQEEQLSRTAIAKVRQDPTPQLWTDIGMDPDLAQSPSLHSAHIRSLITAPIRVGDELKGVLYLSKNEAANLFDQQALDVVSLYANLISLLLGSVSRDKSLVSEVEQAKRDLKTVREHTVVGSSPEMLTTMNHIRKLGPSDISVLIEGETGTGKEVLAREIHRLSTRTEGPFVPVNCGAIPAHLLESELFGHVKGAFTNATHDRTGRIRSAAGGTLFLDEIGEMPLDQQAKLLRVLEDHTVTPVGGDKSSGVDFRLVCATNHNLERAVETNTFRADLYYRIAGFVVNVPSLHERGDDAIELAQFFIKKQAVLLERPDVRLTASAMTAIRNNSWPGNVRELQAAIRRALVVCDGNAVLPEHLNLQTAAQEQETIPLAKARDDFLQHYVRGVVERMNGNRSAAAKALMVTPRTVFKYLEEI